jgi:hypothetical protein
LRANLRQVGQSLLKAKLALKFSPPAALDPADALETFPKLLTVRRARLMLSAMAEGSPADQVAHWRVSLSR